MSPEEIKSMLKDVVSNFIKDEPDTAKENFHAVLSAKLQAKTNPVVPETDEEIAARLEAEASEEASIEVPEEIQQTEEA